MTPETEHTLIYLGIFFLVLAQLTTAMVIIYLMLQVKPLALKLEYVAGTSDIVLEGQKEQTRLIVALVENYG